MAMVAMARKHVYSTVWIRLGGSHRITYHRRAVTTPTASWSLPGATRQTASEQKDAGEYGASSAHPVGLFCDYLLQLKSALFVGPVTFSVSSLGVL
jgi:hypothetical protein